MTLFYLPLAADQPLVAVHSAETTLIIVCTALALLLIPGLGLFYGGMVRRKNVLSTFLQCLIALAVVAIQWVIAGFSLTFGEDLLAGLVGDLQHAFLSKVTLAPQPELAGLIPQLLFMIFELIPTALAFAILSGAVVERMKFSAYLVFCVLWTTLVYDPVAHWTWSPGGWIRQHGGMDFGGGLTVHLTAGASALVCAWVLGKRKGLDSEDLHPHNLTLTAAGTGLLWVGWIGWMVGAARGNWAQAATSLVSTILAGSAGIAGAALLDLLQKRKVTLLGACTGAIAGLVAVTALAGWIEPWAALVVGLLAAPFCHAAISLKSRLGFDDSLDVLGVHGVGGAWGTIALGFLVSPTLTGAPGGLIEGHTEILVAQTAAAFLVSLYASLVTGLILLAVDRLMGLRVSLDEEDLGLDLAQHGQRGYILGEGELAGLGD